MNQQMFADVNNAFRRLSDDDGAYVALCREGELNIEYGKTGNAKLLEVLDS